MLDKENAKQNLQRTDISFTMLEKLFSEESPSSDTYKLAANKIYTEIKSNALEVRIFVSTIFKFPHFSLDLLYKQFESPLDEVNILFSLMAKNSVYLESVRDFSSAVKCFEAQDIYFLYEFLMFYRFDSLYEETLLPLIEMSSFIRIIHILTEEQKLNFINILPRKIGLELIYAAFHQSAISNLFKEKYLDEYLEDIKKRISYVVFDLEADKSTVYEFAYFADGVLYSYYKEDQLEHLSHIINEKKLVIGHNIKAWDLEILAQKNITTNAFIWDTLEVEILLNPCRYTYSLITKHRAGDDAHLTHKLFWNQLYRIASNKDLCERITPLFPKEISDILLEIQQQYFLDTLHKNAFCDLVFFQELKEIDTNISDAIHKIKEISNESILMVAPKALWTYFAKELSVSFPFYDKNLDYLSLDGEKVEALKEENLFLYILLQCFMHFSKTPLLANLSSYIRANYFCESQILTYFKHTNANIDCIDFDNYDSINYTKKYQHIYFIGCELDSRLHSYSLEKTLKASDIFEKKLHVLMRLSGASYMYLDEKERLLFFPEKLPEDISNVWIEKKDSDTYKVCYNCDIHAKKIKLLARFPNAKVHEATWTPKDYSKEEKNIVLMQTNSNKRVSAISRYRASYFCVQFKLIEEIAKESSLPIIYILENSLEKESIENYARELGFYVPTNDVFLKKIEYLSKHTNSLLVLAKNEFDHFISLQNLNDYSYVWDQMAVDKCRMMWHGQIPFGDEAEFEESQLIENLQLKKVVLVQDCLLAMWPTFEYYYNLISLNSPSSKMYLLEPYLDDYKEIDKTWGVSSRIVDLWTSNSFKSFDENKLDKREEIDEIYEKDLKIAQNYFFSKKSTSLTYTEETIKLAQDTILNVFLGENFYWKDYQKSLLPDILTKQDHLLISIPTGGGKSVLFQGPALYNSFYTNRLSLVITPLKALMEDQVLALHKKGFFTNVDYISGDKSYYEIQQIYKKIRSGELVLLYLTPERFRSKAFINALFTRMANDNGLEYFIFDEAHCVTQWGQEFRPDYLNVMHFCKEIAEKYSSTCISMYSATVTTQIEKEIKDKYLPTIKRKGQEEKNYNPIREHIGMEFKFVGHKDQDRIMAIVEYVEEQEINFTKSKMLVFCRTQRQCEETALELQKELIKLSLVKEDKVTYFHAGLDSDERQEIFEKFNSNKIHILCSTKAFGMGMDIPNVHYVIHYSPPSVIEDYLQEVGRAGRNEAMYRDALGNSTIPTVCLYSEQDFKKAKELLLRSALSWQELIDVNNKIIEYITPIQSIEETQKNPVVIPVNLWHKDMDRHDDTVPFRLALYWLENLGKIKIGFLAPTHINISILSKNNPLSRIGSINPLEFKRIKRLFQYIQKLTKKQKNDTVQILIADIQKLLGVSTDTVLNLLIKCQKLKLTRIEQSVYCAISKYRLKEVDYIFSQDKNRFTLKIIFEMCLRILNDFKGQKAEITSQYIEENIKELFEENVQDKKELEGANKEKQYYMPWYEEGENTQNAGYLKVESYTKDLFRKKAKHIFSILSLLKGVNCEPFFDDITKEIAQKVSIKEQSKEQSNETSNYIRMLEEDCLTLLKCIHSHDESLFMGNSFSWTQAMIDLKLEEKGFKYFSDLFYILEILGYIDAKHLLPTGFEIHTTEKTLEKIHQNPEEESADAQIKKMFNKLNQMREIRLASMQVFSSLKEKDKINLFIASYFKCSEIADFIKLIHEFDTKGEESDIIKAFQGEALSTKEKELGVEQKTIYLSETNAHINVKAGPGSGKTHTLALRCAKLVYRQGVDPQQILVLAYNRAVVIELKNRLEGLFSDLGLSRSSSHLHIYNFHQMMKKLCSKDLEGLELEQWEDVFIKCLKKKPRILKSLGDIRYVLIDEFQDITQKRLDTMLMFKKIFPDVSFFTIGDPNQSIYGFDKLIPNVPESTEPHYYYDQLEEKLLPQTFTMKTNYRSYQKILDEAGAFLADKEFLPKSADAIMKIEDQDPYVFIINHLDKSIDAKFWFEEFEDVIRHAKEKEFKDIGVFFRSNAEVYNGYSRIKGMNLEDVRIRIQGTSAGDLYKTREIHKILSILREKENIHLSSEHDFQSKIRAQIEDIMLNFPHWNKFYLDFTYTLILDFINFSSNEEQEYTFLDLTEYIEENCQKDDGQLYKIYDKFKDTRILKDDKLNIILSTIHKIKGLEYDAVIIPPSFQALPYLSTSFEEEKRLMYVAYTRAKKYLRAYKSHRENALENLKEMPSLEKNLGICDEDNLNKIKLSFMASELAFKNNEYIKNKVKKNDALSLEIKKETNYFNISICHNGVNIGELSSKSKLFKRIKSQNGNCNFKKQSLFVNDIYVRTYEETKNHDEKNNTNFAEKWCDEAKKQGYIYLIDFAGYVKIE